MGAAFDGPLIDARSQRRGGAASGSESARQPRDLRAEGWRLGGEWRVGC